MDNIEILLIENVKVNSLDELKSEYIKFILENPIEEIEEQHETVPQPSQQSGTANHHHQEATPQATHRVSQLHEANYRPDPQPHNRRPLPPRRDYSTLAAHAFDK